VGSVEQAGQHVKRGGNEQLCRGAQEGMDLEISLSNGFACTVEFFISNIH
jgi:hypothetical protein